MRARRVVASLALAAATAVGAVVATVAATAEARAGAPELIRPRGWAPLVELAGGGDARAAVTGLEAGLATLRAVLEGLEVDAPTREFVDALRASFADFDLEAFHGLLPLRDGAWRRARVCGRVDGDRYRLATPPPSVRAIDPAGDFGPRPGDLVAEAAARPAPRGEGTNWVVALEAGLGTGSVGWARVDAAAAAGLRLLASGDPHAGTAEPRARPEVATRLRIVETHPGLRPEDVEVLGVLWEAFPRSTALALSLARVEDLLVFDPAGGAAGYQQLRVSGRLEPELLREHAPALADFVEGMGPLFRSDLRWRDARGRTVARAHLETAHLRVTLEAFVKDGRLLPVGDDGRVALEPAAPADAGAFSCVADLAFEVNGVVTELRDLTVDARWARRPGEVRVEGQVTRAPRVVVTSSPLAAVALWLVDVAIPGDLEGLTRELLATACRGDDGRGVSLALVAREAGGGGPSTFQASGRVEVLDSALVRFGFQVANAKLFPDEEVREELWGLLRRARAALEEDLDGFAAVAARTPPAGADR